MCMLVMRNKVWHSIMSIDKTHENTTIIENVDALTAWMAAGVRPCAAWRIGTEHEKLGFLRSDLSPVPYEGAYGISALFEGMRRFGWEGIYEASHIIALERDSDSGRATVTLEPGGQLELSGAPLLTLHETCAEISSHLKEVRAVSDVLGQGWLGIGFSPLWDLDDAAIMPKARYMLMRDHMLTRGKLGREMMYLSCTVQVNLDFMSEADMVEKLRIALALQPIATALFASSPFRGGTLSNCVSERARGWRDTDPDRTGMLPFVFDANFGFERYVEYALDVPMYFVYRDGTYIDARGQSFRDFLRGALPALPNEKPTIDDWENHLSTIFSEARLKRFIEMRGADAGPEPWLCALPAFWVGLIYDSGVQAEVLALIFDWSADEREYLYQNVVREGLTTRFRDGRVLDIARRLVELADKGLAARGYGDSVGQDERKFLAPLWRIVEEERSLADILRSKYENEWGGDIRPIFDEMTF